MFQQSFIVATSMGVFLQFDFMLFQECTQLHKTGVMRILGSRATVLTVRMFLRIQSRYASTMRLPAFASFNASTVMHPLAAATC